jgi:flavin reductase (DIM6/NTAB) family NADH-FMN oxidoreductase RutF
MNSEAIGPALGRVPSGLFIVTYLAGEVEQAMLASWVQQCSFDPPMLSVAVKQGRGISDWLTEGAHFVVNVLAENQTDLVSHFGKGLPLSQLPNPESRVCRAPGTAPVLADALVVMKCEVVDRTTPGDHHVVFGRVMAGEIRGDAKPYVHTRKNGLKY